MRHRSRFFSCKCPKGTVIGTSSFSRIRSFAQTPIRSLQPKPACNCSGTSTFPTCASGNLRMAFNHSSPSGLSRSTITSRYGSSVCSQGVISCLSRRVVVEPLITLCQEAFSPLPCSPLPSPATKGCVMDSSWLPGAGGALALGCGFCFSRSPATQTSTMSPCFTVFRNSEVIAKRISPSVPAEALTLVSFSILSSSKLAAADMFVRSKFSLTFC
mmetsp:Transcript_104904/g.292163  ORF Transcript_104904/g.292163 Transcript_104904/m.292163 type:complete len:215 (-) Transcript_104904:1333-1977(-)